MKKILEDEATGISEYTTHSEATFYVYAELSAALPNCRSGGRIQLRSVVFDITTPGPAKGHYCV